MASYLVSFLLASYVPSTLATAILGPLSTSLPSIFPPAPKGSPGYTRNYRLAFTGIICIWQAYSFLKEGAIDDDWYALLGVTKTVDEDGLKSAFRTLARKHHPDRGLTGSHDYFIAARQAYEFLSDPVKRYAYDRFGPQILSWKAASVREYTLMGLERSIGFYLFTAGIMFVLALIGRAQTGAFYVRVLFAILLVSELSLVLSPAFEAPSAIVQLLVPSYILSMPQFAQISLLHRLFTSLSVSINQLTGVWSDESSETSNREEEWRAVMTLLRSLNQEAANEFHNQTVPLLASGGPDAVSALIKSSMENVMVDRALATHPKIQEPYHEAQSRAHIPQSSPLRPRQPSRAHSQASPQRWTNAVKRHNRQDLGVQLQIAVDTPLPPSPPPTPRLRSRVL